MESPDTAVIQVVITKNQSGNFVITEMSATKTLDKFTVEPTEFSAWINETVKRLEVIRG